MSCTVVSVLWLLLYLYLYIYFNTLQIKLTHIQNIEEIKGEKKLQDLRVSWQLVPAAVINLLIVYLYVYISVRGVHLQALPFV